MALLIGLSGSLRRASFNTGLLHEAARLAPAGTSIDVRTLHGIPLYDGDEQAAHGVPDVVAALKDAIAGADGLLIATPEYNHAMPGVLKNAIDWLSRPPADIRRVFGGKPVAIIGASTGGFGTALAQASWLPVMRALGTTLWTGGRLLVPRAQDVFDADGRVTDATIRQHLADVVARFAGSIAPRA